MKIYVLVAKTENKIVNPTYFGRAVRAYKSEGIAKSLSKKFGCAYIEVDLSEFEAKS